MGESGGNPFRESARNTTIIIIMIIFIWEISLIIIIFVISNFWSGRYGYKNN